MTKQGLVFEQPSEGFRGIRWCTRRSDIPWQWSTNGFASPCAQRANEVLELFGITATELTYTFRNSLLYGVRLDMIGNDQSATIIAALKEEYPPSTRVERRGHHVWRWQTNETSVWIETSSLADEMVTAYLWGRHRMFADDCDSPAYLALPPHLNSFAGPYKPRHYICYRTSGPITIDGRLKEKAWRDAQWTDFFEDHQAPYAPAPWKSVRVKMLYDDEHLYIGAELQEENVWGSLVERDCIIYYDNDFEVFLDPTADGIGYYELEVNPLNTMWDMFHETDYHRASALHTLYDVAQMEHAVHVQGTLNWHKDTDIGWTVEMKIPFKSLLERNPRFDVPIKHGTVWRANFSRVQYLHLYDQLYPTKIPNTPCEDWVWQSTDTGDLHNPEMWGKVIFSDKVAGTLEDKELEQNFKTLQIPSHRTQYKTLAETMVYLPATTCIIGPDPTDVLRSPAHEVQVDSFWIDPFPVTVAQYTIFLNQGNNDIHYSTWMRLPERCGIVQLVPGHYEVIPGREEYPVVYVTYESALAYAQSLGKNLPSEIQWERAARGAAGRRYAWGDEPIGPDRANYDFHYGGTTPVGVFAKGATPEMVFDMTGNVKEYTTSVFAPYPGGEEMIYLGMRKPFIYDKPSIFQVVRGGAWTKQERCMAAAYRDAHGSLNMGFRCIREH